MPRPVYFDTSVFLDIFTKSSPNRLEIFNLLRELKESKVTIFTSILTVEEASVLTYRRGHIAYDNHAAINKMAKIWGIDRDVAMTTAKHEADIRDMFHKSKTQEEMKDRRRWDCFHIATAQVRECSHLYTTDPGMMKRKGHLGLPDLQILPPRPVSATLNFPSNLVLVPPPT